MKKGLMALLLLVCAGARAEVISGEISNWLEAGNFFKFEDQAPIPSNLVAWWSIEDSREKTGWWYAMVETNQIAIAPTGDITQITDASQYVFEDFAVGPVSVGQILVLRDTRSGYYGALRINAASEDGFAVDATWFLQTNGTPNLSQ